MKLSVKSRRLILLFIVGGILEIAALSIDEGSDFDSIVAPSETSAYRVYQELKQWPPLLRGEKGFNSIIRILAKIEPINKDVDIGQPLEKITLAVRRGGSTMDMDKDDGKYIQIKVYIANRVLKPNEKPVILNDRQIIQFRPAPKRMIFSSSAFLVQIKNDIRRRIYVFKWSFMLIGLLLQAYGVYREVREQMMNKKKD